MGSSLGAVDSAWDRTDKNIRLLAVNRYCDTRDAVQFWLIYSNVLVNSRRLSPVLHAQSFLPSKGNRFAEDSREKYFVRIDIYG